MISPVKSKLTTDSACVVHCIYVFILSFHLWEYNLEPELAEGRKTGIKGTQSTTQYMQEKREHGI